MKNKDEELIQGLSIEDMDVYQILFRELAQETHIDDDFNLADKVVRQISSKQHKAESVRYTALLVAIGTVFLLMTSLSIMFVDQGFIRSVFTKISTNIEVTLFIILSLTAIQVLDKMVRKQAQLPHE
ncbi:MAG: hypothetical protein V4594_09570 [Bacteroidota bacterium]